VGVAEDIFIQVHHHQLFQRQPMVLVAMLVLKAQAMVLL
jgi:hypothetical protein